LAVSTANRRRNGSTTGIAEALSIADDLEASLSATPSFEVELDLLQCEAHPCGICVVRQPIENAAAAVDEADARSIDIHLERDHFFAFAFQAARTGSPERGDSELPLQTAYFPLVLRRASAAHPLHERAEPALPTCDKFGEPCLDLHAIAQILNVAYPIAMRAPTDRSATLYDRTVGQ
jgi:hypothetical protein